MSNECKNLSVEAADAVRSFVEIYEAAASSGTTTDLAEEAINDSAGRLVIALGSEERTTCTHCELIRVAARSTFVLGELASAIIVRGQGILESPESLEVMVRRVNMDTILALLGSVMSHFEETLVAGAENGRA